MIATKNTTYHFYKLLIWLTVLICTYQAFTKGWASLLLVPLSLIVLPLYIGLEYTAFKRAIGLYARQIVTTALVLTIALLAAYIFTIGYDDTDITFLFGFYLAPESAFITQVSHVISFVAYIVAPITFVVLIGLLIAHKKRHKK